jgi:hypothetical protein
MIYPEKHIELASLLLNHPSKRGNTFEPAKEFEDIIIEEEQK